MKKLISTLMIGLVTATCAMTTMAAPSHHDSHRYDRKSVHHVGFKKHAPKKHFSQHDRRDMRKFDNRNHHAFNAKHDRFDHRLPPRHR
ncbi:hypothetical protein G9F31_08870 [Acinetobacter sp. 187]|uniref:Uncharacterized protein n=1 Tax=Acinetobacter lanii TaxID=2715163 RepID=A0A6G8S148_9GAMM|nr:hypothetical protein [Acinetobacter lanii]NHC03881.1 hypothetical protein [Acinetobacter lanii]QIO07867.1 hypothetical protein G8D99_01710 [Acinetobacter lanii]